MTLVQSAAKVYYIEEQVTVLLEIIQKAAKNPLMMYSKYSC